MNIRKLRNLFLSQSYLDAIKDYDHVLEEGQKTWDYVVLTASNEAQAEAFRNEIKVRLQEGRIPADCQYAVLPDPEGKRVGSGGATFNVLKYIAQTEGDFKHLKNPFSGKKIMVIHSGGDSKRVPQYSVCGKLFSPVPREQKNGRASTLFDEFMIIMSSVSRRIGDGMLVLSGDVLLLFNPLQLDLQYHGAAAISIKEHVHIGKDHGVFLRDEQSNVKMFLHKQSEEKLRALGAVNEQDNVDLDTGAVLLDTDLMQDLYCLISTDGSIDDKKFAQFVNERARVSFYGDFLYPLASDATLEDYYEQAPEGELCEELLACRTAIWNRLSKYQMKVFCLSPAEFIHFGTTTELLHLVTDDIANYEFLGWQQHVASNIEIPTCYAANGCAITRSQIGAGAYLENSIVKDCEIGAGSIVANLDLRGATVPEKIVLHGVTLENGQYLVRIYGVADNPKAQLRKGAQFLGQDVQKVLDFYHIAQEQIWENAEDYLWFAGLYAAADTVEKAVEEALLVYRIFQMQASLQEAQSWLLAKRYSLYSSFNQADVNAVMKWNKVLEEEIVLSRFLTRLENDRPYEEALQVFDGQPLDRSKRERLNRIIGKVGFSKKIRICYALSMYPGIDKGDRESYNKQCFGTISDTIYENMTGNIAKRKFHIAKDYVKVQLPVRVNWGGGWTDTPPYCLEHGGLVLNAAMKLNGTLPICVEMRRIEEKRIKVSSEDIGVEGYIDSVEELLNCNDPYDYYALHKAAMIACGLISLHGETRTLTELLDELGGGFELSTKVIGIPKGSGLGTSSILSAACVKAVYEFMGCDVSDEETYQTVSCMEQIMSTGGGWQDQVGGITPGIKFITTAAGIDQKIHVDYVALSDAIRQELKERFVVIYTGQRRLARNLLRDVVGNYIGARPESVQALHEMKRIATLMRFELEQGDLDAFARLFNRHWELSLQLDGGATNTCIDQIFLAIEDYIDGKFIAGAGGGGFLQVILKKGVTKEMLHNRLSEVFQGTGIDVWDCELLWEDEQC